MTLIIEKHPEFDRLARYFKKIESLADNMGVKVDDLLKLQPVLKGNVIETSFLPEQQNLAEQRKDIFKSHLSIVK